MHEASMNFDLDNIRPFLERLQGKIEPSFSVDQLVEFTESVKVEDEQLMSFQVQWNGSEMDLQYSVHMDDIDAPDLYFFSSSKELVNVINSEMMSFAEDNGL